MSAPNHQTDLLTSYIKLMNLGLEKNMYKLTEAVVNSEVGNLSGRVERYIDRTTIQSRGTRALLECRTSTSLPTIISALRRFLGGEGWRIGGVAYR